MTASDDSKPSELTADIIARLYATILSRQDGDAAKSYVASLLQKGKPTIARKVGEEAIETVVAALGDDRESLIAESADLLFHLMVLWVDAGIRPAEVFQELARREGFSGHEEKSRRKE